MKKLLLLDADVIMDLHTLGLFEKFIKAYEMSVTRTVVGETKYFKKDGQRQEIYIRDTVTIIDNVDIDSLMHGRNEAKEARLGIDAGELESIAYMINAKKDVIFCSCDAAAIKLIAYMKLDNQSISVEKALLDTGYRKRNLYPRHYQKTYERHIKAGKVLRVQFKKLT
ncbi:MAG: hypothetical protein DRH21_00625 [Deltaproteobacteria bacterium]|nr:MAG: hypothetical protein DRH21_00625 [Deltaproteobacteria bacterium]